jgi:hypothetical protein
MRIKDVLYVSDVFSFSEKQELFFLKSVSYCCDQGGVYRCVFKAPARGLANNDHGYQRCSDQKKTRLKAANKAALAFRLSD